MTELRELLLWARDHRIVFGQVTIGACTVTVTDLGIRGDKRPGKGTARDIRSQFAGSAKDALRAAGIISDDGDDDEPAVQ